MLAPEKGAAMPACSGCGEDLPSRARFCPGCGVVVAEGEGERRIVTVVFADLSGFTSWSEHTDPEQVRAVADAAAAGMIEVVQNHGGTVDKVIGDCVMGVFGAPVAHEDDPERAVRAALGMRDFVEENAERLAGMPLSIGVNTGEVMFATVGGSFTVIGDTVNTAARLQSAASRGQILVGAATAQACAGAIDLVEVDPIVAKGKDEPVAAFLAVAARDAAPRRIRRRAPLIGRDLELGRLTELWQRVQGEARPQLACILGDAGLGKSRVVAELLDRAADARVLRGHCLAYGEGITYWPVLEILRDLADIEADDEPLAVIAKLDALLTATGSEDLQALRTMAGAVSVLFGSETTPRGTYRVRELGQGELHWGLRRLLELLSREEPLIVVVEDLHWAEPALLELLAFLADGNGQFLVVATARPELRDAEPVVLERAPNRRVIDLAPLDAADSLQLVARLLGLDDVPPALANALADVSGNPLFLEEVVRMLADDGLTDFGQAVGEGPPRDDIRISLPPTVQALIDARLDSLDVDVREVLGHAAVAGAVFPTSALAALVGDAGRLDAALAELQHRDLLRATGEDLAFTHALVRDAAYARLAKTTRVTLHRRCAGWLSSRPAADDLIELVAHHLEQACLLAMEVSAADAPPTLEAVESLRLAALRAQRRSGIREAVRFYERALALVGPTVLPETTTELRLHRSQALAVLGRFDDAAAEMEDVASAAERVQRDDLRCGALVDLAKIERVTGKVPEAASHVTEAEAVARRLADDALVLKTVLAAGLVEAARGEVELSAARFREGVGAAARLEDTACQAEAHLQLGALLFNQGRLAEAEDEFSTAAMLGATEGSVHQQAQATFCLGMLKRYRGPRDEAEALSAQAVEWLDRVANRYVEIQARRTLVALALSRGEHTLAEERARAGLEAARDLPAWTTCALQRDLTRALARQGHLEAAAQAAQAAREAAAAGAGTSVARADLAEADVAAAAGDLERARAGYGRALQQLEERSLRLDAAEVRLEMGEALAELGDIETAREVLQQALDTLSAMGAHAVAAEAASALGSLPVESIAV